MTAVLLGNVVWEGLSTERNGVAAIDGHFYKEMDTGESYFRRAGAWVFVNLGLSFIKATKSGSVVTNGSGIADVTFATPFSGTDYIVSLSCFEDGSSQPARAGFSNIAAGGFRITTRYTRTGNIRPDTTASWVATRNYNP